MTLTATFSPISGGYGRLVKNDGGSFAANHDATASNLQDTTGNIATRPAGGSHEVGRFFAPFNTSSIGSSATVVSAFVRLIANGGTFTNVDSTSIYLVDSTQDDTSSLTTADFDQLGTTNFGSLAFASYNNTDLANNDITITDLAKISKTGVTKIALRTKRDSDNSAPTGENAINWTASTMILSVTYSIPDTDDDYAYFM